MSAMFRWYFGIVAFYLVLVGAGVARATVIMFVAIGGTVLCIIPCAVCAMRVWRRK